MHSRGERFPIVLRRSSFQFRFPRLPRARFFYFSSTLLTPLVRSVGNHRFSSFLLELTHSIAHVTTRFANGAPGGSPMQTSKSAHFLSLLVVVSSLTAIWTTRVSSFRVERETETEGKPEGAKESRNAQVSAKDLAL